MASDSVINFLGYVLSVLTFLLGQQSGKRQQRNQDLALRVQQAKDTIDKISIWSITYYVELKENDLAKEAIAANILNEFQNLGRSLLEIDRRKTNKSEYVIPLNQFNDSITDSPFRERFEPMPSTAPKLEEMQRSKVPLLEWLDHVID